MTLPLSQIARRLQAPEANVWQVHEDALERKRAGDDIVLLSVGDPDLSTPDYIADYTVAQIRLGRTHYSPAAGNPNCDGTWRNSRTVFLHAHSPLSSSRYFPVPPPRCTPRSAVCSTPATRWSFLSRCMQPIAACSRPSAPKSLACLF
jgi:hypothetical protein